MLLSDAPELPLDGNVLQDRIKVYMLDSGPRTARPEGGSQREPVRWTALICIDEAATNALSQKGIFASGFIHGIRDQLAEESP